MRTGKLLLAGAAAVITLAMVAGGSMANDVIQDRQAGFKQNVASMRAMTASLKDGDIAAMAAPAQQIAAQAARIPSLFPQGSDQGETKALPAIWGDWNGFTTAAKNNEDAAQALAAVATGGGDAAAAEAALKALGATCGACHDAFRAK